MATKKTNENVEELFEGGIGFKEDQGVVDELPLVHTMIRSISTTAVPLEGTDPIFVVDAEVGYWVSKGYKLISTHFLGQDPNGFMFAYILAKQ